MTRALLALLLSSSLMACGSGDSSNPDSSTGGAGGSAGGGTGGSAGAGSCNDDPRFRPPGGVCVEQVSGSVVDGAGAPVADIQVGVCGSICFYGNTDATGAFVVDVFSHIIPGDYAALAHGRPSLTNFYRQVPAGAQGSFAIGSLLVLDLPASGPSLVVKTDKQGAPAQTVTSNAVTLDVAAGVSVKLDVEDVALGDLGKMFRALSIPAEHRSSFVDDSLNVVALYNFMPFEASFVEEGTSVSATAQLSIDNEAGLPASALVEFLALGTYLYSDWVKPGAFEVVATGSVSSDGTKIDMDPGQGIEHLTWIGVRAK